MGKLKTITRRTLMFGSVAIAGGVAFGYYAYKRPIPNPLLDLIDDDQTALTPYLIIDQQGVTIITPRTEVGQGAYTILAAMVAEELDIAWRDIRVDHGPPSTAYYNGKVAAEGLPFAATDTGFMARRARGFGDVIGKFMKLHITGGSTTVPDAFIKMRTAGAAARLVLMDAAARRTDTDVGQLSTRDGHVLLPGGDKIAYTALAADAAEIDLPESPALKPQSEWRYLGTPLQRLDVVAKSTGTAEYGIDLDMPDMVYATVVTNPGIGAVANSFDAGEAGKARGIISVVPITGGAAVLADNTWRAFQAAKKIRFDWQSAPYPADSDAMFEAVSAAFVKDRRDSRFRNDGDVDETLVGDDVIEAEYRLPYLAHAPLEPMNATVRYTTGRIDIWTASQVPMQIVETASALTGLDSDDIHVHTLIAGGSFGRRLEDDYVRQAIEVALTTPGTPVKMTWTREQDMTHDFCRPLGMARMRGRVADGSVDAYDLSIAYPSVTASQTGRLGVSVPGPDVAIVAGAWDQPYDIANYRVTGYRVPELAPVSSWRSVGASGNGFFHDGFLDELIHAAGADPVEARLRMMNHAPSRQVLEAAANMSRWGDPLPEGSGRGVAFCLSFGVPCAIVVEVTDTPDGIRIDHAYVAADVGTVLDPDGVNAQMSGGTLWGLGHAMLGEITFADGGITQSNFHQFLSLRMGQAPDITTKALENLTDIRGIGEPCVPPAAPALANAIFAATGQRIRELPLSKHVRFAERARS